MNPPPDLVGDDFLDRLLDRAAGKTAVVQPRVPSLFEPEQGFQASFVGGSAPEPFGAVEAERSSPWAAELPATTERPSEQRAVSPAEALDTAADARERVDRALPPPGEPRRGGPPASRAGGAPERGLLRALLVHPPALVPDAGSNRDAMEAPELGTSAGPSSPARPSPSADGRGGLSGALRPAQREPAGTMETLRSAFQQAPGQSSPHAPSRRGPSNAGSPFDRGGALLPSSPHLAQRAGAQGPPADRRARPDSTAERGSITRETVVNVTIGRLEVRASQESRKAPRTEMSGPRPMSLDDYLRARAGAQ